MTNSAVENNLYLADYIDQQLERAIGVYQEDIDLLEEHANLENALMTSGYARRQVLELVQNAADALLKSGSHGRVGILLTENSLYVANEGTPIDQDGARALTHAYLSKKTGDEIGRFGQGFKSVLAVTSNPQIFSKSVSFEFNAARTKQFLNSRLSEDLRLPILRLPWLIDRDAEERNDENLRELFSWASTVIKLPLREGHSQLKNQLEKFPTRFLLFAKHVNLLEIEIRVPGDAPTKFSHTCEKDVNSENIYTVSRPDSTCEQWLLKEAIHKPSEKAKEQIGLATVRDEIKIAYAAPLKISSAGSIGGFWAYYPLSEETTATGIFNAPWALNEDRTTMLRTAYNSEILEHFASIFVDTITTFSTKESPSEHFKYLPSRPDEVKGYSDKVLTHLIPRIAASVGIIPDQNGTLRDASALKVLPFSREFSNWQHLKQSITWHEIWQRNVKEDVLVPHFSVYGDSNRFTRLRQLFTEYSNFESFEPTPLNQWLEMLLADESDLHGMAVALRLLAAIPDENARKNGSSAKIILTNQGLASPSQYNSVFLPMPDYDDTELPGVKLVVPELISQQNAETSLRSLKFSDIDPGEFAKYLFGSLGISSTDSDWLRAWDSILNVASKHWVPMLQKIFTEKEIKVLTLAGEWRPARGCFVRSQTSRGLRFKDDRYVVDTHVCPPELAELAGALAAPIAHFDTQGEPQFEAYLQWARLELRRAFPDMPVAKVMDADFDDSLCPGPFSVYELFDDEDYAASAADWSSALLKLTNPSNSRWTIRTQSNEATLNVLAPHLWAVMQYGYLKTSLGIIQTRNALGSSALNYAAYFPVALDPVTRALQLPDKLEDIPLSIWLAFFSAEHNCKAPSPKLRQEYSDMVLHGIQVLENASSLPEKVPAIVNDSLALRKLSEVQLTVGVEEREQIAELGVPYLVVATEEDRETICSRTTFKNASASISVTLERIPITLPELVIDRFPALSKYLDENQQEASLQFCSGLYRRLRIFGGLKDEPLESDFYGGTIYLVEGLSKSDILDRVCGHLGLGLTAEEQANVLQEIEDQRVAQLRERCRSAITDAERIALLASSEELIKLLPSGLKPSLSSFGIEIDDKNAAQVFLDTHGYNALQTLRTELEALGLNPPLRWTGRSSSVRFVQSLGFDRAFAGESTPTPPPTETILGRPGLHPLHDYQEAAYTRIREVLTSNIDEARRGMVELPTGAGKTRVAVESIIRLFLSGELVGPVLWIAESDELCSQAVETWSEVWREFADNRSLTIARFWGSRDIEEPATELSVVIATDAKLLVNLPLEAHSIEFSTHEYAWLEDVSAVIVDEAHRATSPTYSSIFRFFGIGSRGKTARPLLGLSATPFRGRSSELTERLANRFGKNLITTLGENPISELQKRGVLAEVEHEFLQGTTINLTASMVFDTEDRFAISRAEDLVLREVGSDSQRTKRLVDHIKSRPTGESILVFTSSVLNAEVVAALLINQGLTAAAISGSTRPNLRRSLIAQFKTGQIQVLVNCDVLLQGFDAPKVRTLYVARPTFSPSRYIQMVGRGLRGPKNGGTERCLIVDLQDELVGSRHELAYREFTNHWKVDNEDIS